MDFFDVVSDAIIVADSIPRKKKKKEEEEEDDNS